MERPGLNPARSVTSIATAQQIPSEQEVYATAMLYRQKSKQGGATLRFLMPGSVTGDPPGDAAGMIAASIVGYRRSIQAG